MPRGSTSGGVLGSPLTVTDMMTAGFIESKNDRNRDSSESSADDVDNELTYDLQRG